MLHNAPIAEYNPSPYSVGVQRALRAALALDVKTKGLKVVFKNGATADFDLILFESTLEINNKWLDFKQSHSNTVCWLSRQSNDEPSTMSHFSCDHIALTLYELVLEEGRRDPGFTHRESSESKATLCQKVSENLRHMPMMVETCLGGPGEIIVSWVDRDGGMVSRVYGLNPKLEITLHKELSCGLKRCDLLRSGKSLPTSFNFGSRLFQGLYCPNDAKLSFQIPNPQLPLSKLILSEVPDVAARLCSYLRKT